MTLQLAPALMLPPVRLTVPEAATADSVPPVHVVLAPLGVATTTPLGRPSKTATPVRATVFAAGLVIVIVSVEVPPGTISAAAKAFVIVGGISTAIVALAVKPVPPLVELTAPVVLLATPDVVSDTVAVTVQLPLAAIVPPLSTIDVEVEEATEPLVQVVATPVWVIPEGRLSVTATPVRAAVFVAGFEIVRVNVVEPVVCAMLAAANDLVIVGGAITTIVAEPVLPVPPLVELTAPVVLVLDPAVVPVTLTVRAQLELTASEPPVKLTELAFAFAVNVPPQVLVAPGVLATVKPAGKVSLTAKPVCV